MQRRFDVTRWQSDPDAAAPADTGTPTTDDGGVGDLDGGDGGLDPQGTKWGEIPFPESRPTGVAFGGADGATVYITTERGNDANGTLFTMQSRCAGVR